MTEHLIGIGAILGYILIGSIIGWAWARFMPVWMPYYSIKKMRYISTKTPSHRAKDFWGLLLFWPYLLVISAILGTAWVVIRLSWYVFQTKGGWDRIVTFTERFTTWP